MNDEKFDDIARAALAFEAGPPNEAAWNRIRPRSWSWLPTVREILVCGGVCALALGFVGLRIARNRASVSEPNTVIQSAMRDEPQSILASIGRIADTPQLGDWAMPPRNTPPELNAAPR